MALNKASSDKAASGGSGTEQGEVRARWQVGKVALDEIWIKDLKN